MSLLQNLFLNLVHTSSFYDRSTYGTNQILQFSSSCMQWGGPAVGGKVPALSPPHHYNIYPRAYGMYLTKKNVLGTSNASIVHLIPQLCLRSGGVGHSKSSGKNMEASDSCLRILFKCIPLSFKMSKILCSYKFAGEAISECHTSDYEKASFHLQTKFSAGSQERFSPAGTLLCMQKPFCLCRAFVFIFSSSVLSLSFPVPFCNLPLPTPSPAYSHSELGVSHTLSAV